MPTRDKTGPLFDAFAQIEREWAKKKPAGAPAKLQGGYASGVRTEHRVALSDPETHYREYICKNQHLPKLGPNGWPER